MATGATEQTTYAAYWLFALDAAYMRLPDAEQARGKAEFLRALDARPESVSLRGAYSMVGLREDVDFMLWVVSDDLDTIQRLAVNLRHTGLGRYLTTRQTYVGVVAGGRYDPAHSPAFMQGAPPKSYISVYPFVKTSDWYLLPYERRRELMAEHGLVGRRYAVPREQVAASSERRNGHERGASGATAVAQTLPQTETEGGGVLANTVDAFGLGDYEFILANESDDPSELVRMMESLRATEVRRFTKQDTPIFLGRLREPAEVMADL
ncbi:MAG: chlorite dismutase family protein [Ktedonobacterales bacterium]